MILMGVSASRSAGDDQRRPWPAPDFTFQKLDNLGYDARINRRDPSDVIRVEDTYFVWYTRYKKARAYYDGTIWYATSPNGRTWHEQSQVVGPGHDERWDGESVFTPNVLVTDNRYYLFYTAIGKAWTPRFSTAIGAAVATSPHGPWHKLEQNPLLKTGTGQWQSQGTGWHDAARSGAAWDSHVVDDACLIVRNGRYWLYYKGRQMGLSPRQTKLGVAIADKPTGPYRKHPDNPLIKSGHEALVAPYREGVLAVVTRVGPQRNTIQFASDGIDFDVKAPIAHPPHAPGAYRPDAFSDDGHGKGLRWGISMGMRKGQTYLKRYEGRLAPRSRDD
jgi:hypothetical protein